MHPKWEMFKNTPSSKMVGSETAKQPLVVQHFDDFVVLGRYTMLVCLLTELAFLSQLSNTMYMWDIHCERRYLERRSTSIQMFGVMIGSLSSGQISSSFGRKKPMVICLAMTGLLSLATYFVNDLVQFTIIRFVLGIFTGGHSTYLHESPRWLVQHGKIPEARRVILSISHIDGDKAKIDEKVLDRILQTEHDVRL
ncbi:hypothetical protein OSTOST_07608 [Ostertagia ostertagi]